MLLKWVENRSPRFGSARLRLAVLGVWLATFAVAAPLMRNLEHRMVERDRKIRIAATSVLIASDLTRVCGPDRDNVAVDDTVLPSGTRVESLEVRMCSETSMTGQGRVGLDLLPRAVLGADRVERVRVLEGLYEGMDGWVLSASLWRPLPLP